MVMKNKEELKKYHRAEQPKETGQPSAMWDPCLAPGTGKDSRGRTGEI